jgi:gliding motility-associated-like protein
MDHVQVVVQPLPEVQLAATDTSCFGGPIVLNPGGSNAYTYQWSPAQFLNDATLPSPIAEVDQSTIFYVTVTDQTPAACSIVDSILLFIPPDVDLGAPADTSYCGSPAITLNATGSGIEYTWFASGGTVIGTGPTITLQPTEETTYILEGRDIYGCEVQTTVTLTPNFLDYTRIEDDLICPGETAILSIQNNNPAHNLTYQWTPQTGIVGPNDQASVTVMPLVNTTYTVQIVLPGLGCTAEESFDVQVSGFDPPNLVISVEPDSIVAGQSFVLSTNQDPGLFYFWDGPGIVNPNLPVITASPLASGVYSYAVTITNSAGCRLTGSISNLVVVNPLCSMEDVFIPQAFSPNGDGENDVLLVYGNFIDAMELRIFNRWGEMVFESFDQLNGWDGTFKGKDLAPDVFGYYLRVECPPDKMYFTKGNITLFK